MTKSSYPDPAAAADDISASTARSLPRLTFARRRLIAFYRGQREDRPYPATGMTNVWLTRFAGGMGAGGERQPPAA